jgi:hypothetical protein
MTYTTKFRTLTEKHTLTINKSNNLIQTTRIASIFIPKDGTAKLCNTSEAVTKILVSTNAGRYSG